MYTPNHTQPGGTANITSLGCARTIEGLPAPLAATRFAGEMA
jgi:hypothetical protein